MLWLLVLVVVVVVVVVLTRWLLLLLLLAVVVVPSPSCPRLPPAPPTTLPTPPRSPASPWHHHLREQTSVSDATTLPARPTIATTTSQAYPRYHTTTTSKAYPRYTNLRTRNYTYPASLTPYLQPPTTTSLKASYYYKFLHICTTRSPNPFEV